MLLLFVYKINFLLYSGLLPVASVSILSKSLICTYVSVPLPTSNFLLNPLLAIPICPFLRTAVEKLSTIPISICIDNVFQPFSIKIHIVVQLMITCNNSYVII